MTRDMSQMTRENVSREHEKRYDKRHESNDERERVKRHEKRHDKRHESNDERERVKRDMRRDMSQMTRENVSRCWGSYLCRLDVSLGRT